MHRPLIAAALALCLAPSVLAAPSSESDPTLSPRTPFAQPRQGVGFAVGSTSGVGFAWRQIFANGWGYQVAGAGGYLSVNPVNGPSWSLGLQATKDLSVCDWGRFYAVGGVQDLQIAAPSLLNVGAGVGVEMGGTPGVTVSFELPLVFGYRFGDNAGPAHLLPIPNLLLIFNY